jgi:anti-sigma B factor antagonist
MMDVHIDRRPDSDGTTLVVQGRLDAESAAELRQAVSAEVRRGMHLISLDLAAVTFLSSAGIRVLFETQREARAAGGDCQVRAVSEPVRKVLELTRLDAILMRPAREMSSRPPVSQPAQPAAREVIAAGLRLLGFEPPPRAALAGQILGAAVSSGAAGKRPLRVHVGPQTFAFGLAALADEGAATATAGEVLAACGAVYHRPPRPFAAVDYVLSTGDLVPEIDVVSGISWQGVPGGRAAFEPADDRPAVAIDELITCLFEQASAHAVAVVIAGEVQGLVAAELIRPLAEATPTDHPLAGTREAAANWLCFSREPVHAARTAVIVGVACREADGPLAELVASLGPTGVKGHLHAVVFPHRLLGRAGGDVAAVVADLAASEPLAVVHLMADNQPVLGSGVSELIRGFCWFAPLSFAEGGE